MGGTPPPRPARTDGPAARPRARHRRRRRAAVVAPTTHRALTASALVAGVVGAAAVSEYTAPSPAPGPDGTPVRPAGDRAVALPGPALVPVAPAPAREPTRAKSTAPRRAAPPPPRAPAALPDAGAGIVGALFDSARGDFTANFDNSGNSGLVEQGRRPSVITDADAPSGRAFGFALGPGGKRSEVQPKGPGTKPRDGETQTVRYSFELGADFPVDTDQWQILLQWHHTSSSGSPPLALEISRGQLMMVGGGDEQKVIGPVRPGQRVTLTMQVRFAQNPSQGSVTVLRDGRPTGVTGWRPSGGTMSTPTSYLKMGYYRSTDITRSGSFTVTDLKIAPGAR